jgi:branched-chain amino acid transport system ATP-binding protein
MCDRSYLLETGRVVAAGSAAEMLVNSDIRKAYLGG